MPPSSMQSASPAIVREHAANDQHREPQRERSDIYYVDDFEAVIIHFREEKDCRDEDQAIERTQNFFEHVFQTITSNVFSLQL